MGVSQHWSSPSQGHLREQMPRRQVDMECQTTHQRCLPRSGPSYEVMPVCCLGLHSGWNRLVSLWSLGIHSVIDPGGEWGHPVACIRALSGCILLAPSSRIPAAEAVDEVCSKSSTITCLVQWAWWTWRWRVHQWGLVGSPKRCLTGLLLLWWHTLLLCSAYMASATGLWAAWQGVTSWLLGNLFLLPSTEGDLA